MCLLFIGKQYQNQRKDEEFIDLFFERSEQAISELAGKHGRVINRVAFHILGDLEDAKECVDDKKLKLLPNKHECYLNGERLALTQKEFSILQVLMENRGHTVSTKELSGRVWDDAVYIIRNDSVAVHIRYLREKMQNTLKPFFYVKTV